MIVKDPSGMPKITTFVDDTPALGQFASVKPLQRIKSFARAFEFDVNMFSMSGNENSIRLASVTRPVLLIRQVAKCLGVFNGRFLYTYLQLCVAIFHGLDDPRYCNLSL